MKRIPPITVTIVTVTFNAEKTLPVTLKSVAEQTYPYVEHLLIDGCSTDGTMTQMRQYTEENTGRPESHYIHLVREPDKGLYDAMNKAIAMATGDYIIFLNAGDRLHSPDTLWNVFGPEDVRERRPAIIYGETDIVDLEGNFIRHRRLKAPKKLSWFKFCQGMVVCHQSFYVLTEQARQEPYNLNYRFSADYDWCLRLLKRARSLKLAIHNSGLVLTDYLNEGMTTQNHRSSLQERFRIMCNHFGWPIAVIQHGWFVVRAVLKR